MWLSCHTQEQVAEVLGWKRTQVANYHSLSRIGETAWNIVTANVKNVTVNEDGIVTKDVTGVTFTEGLLRDITKKESLPHL